ncbi:MAG TPA: SMP-30/gluconolactonase/LRE family protein [Polyangiaceae bacterium]|nr:SMP-30/gluconolactonase/LRE family protein [Polyangiaceae bacterium]
MVLANPSWVEKIAFGIDHVESVFVEDDGTLFAGGEKGQIYRVAPGEPPAQIACTHGELLGIVLDGGGRIYVCDSANRAVFRISPAHDLQHEDRQHIAGAAQNAPVECLSTGAPGRPFTFPNHPAFDALGNLYVSDSGDYWDPSGSGCIQVIRRSGETEVFHHGPFRFANGIAIDPSGKWLYIAQSAAWNIVRIPLDRPNGQVELAFQLPEYTIPDGMLFSSDGSLIVACYRPDSVLRCKPDGGVETLIADPTGELLLAPTNVFLHAGYLYVANLAGRFVSRMKTELRLGSVHRPVI